MLKNKRSYSTFHAIAPEHLTSEEITQSDSKEEDEDETNINNNWSVSRRNKKKRPKINAVVTSWLIPEISIKCWKVIHMIMKKAIRKIGRRIFSR